MEIFDGRGGGAVFDHPTAMDVSKNEPNTPTRGELSLQKPTRAPVEKFHPLETEGQVDSKLHLELDAKFQSASLDVLFFVFDINEGRICLLLTVFKHN